MEEKMTTNELINAFKTWDGKAWLQSHMAWLKGSYQMSRIPVPPPKRKAAKKKLTPFFPCVAHASSFIGNQAGYDDKGWREESLALK